MATKVTILGEEPTEKKELKPIEVVGKICCTGSKKEEDWISLRYYNLKRCTEIKIIKITGYSNFDCLIINQDDTVLLGHFNDGVV